MYTYQDFLAAVQQGDNDVIAEVIKHHVSSDLYKIAVDADEYDAQRNVTIAKYTKWLYSSDGNRAVDALASNNKLASNFFNRLNTQRMAYSLGNGITFAETDATKEKLGIDFDTQLRTAGYYGLIHGVAFMFFNSTRTHVFKVTEFAPLYDEETGALRAGIRFWQIDHNKPTIAILYEEDGYTKYRGSSGKTNFQVVEEKRSYILKTRQAAVDPEPEVIAEENYGGVLPIVPFYGSRLKQSTLVGMRPKIDAYDLIDSGFANDEIDVSEIYWLISGAGGSDDDDLAHFRERLKLTHIANVPDAADASVTPYTQEIPYQSRTERLKTLREGIYEDFGGLDVHTVAAGATNDHIDAAYQPMDECADDFEFQLIEGVQAILRLIGIEDTPVFKRNRISNQKETVEMLCLVESHLDDETFLKKLPFISPDEVDDILGKVDEAEMNRFEDGSGNGGDDEDGDGNE